MPTFRFRLRLPTDPITVEDFRIRARHKLPDLVWAFVDYGAEDMVTLRENRTAFTRYRLHPRVLSGVGFPRLTTTVAGRELSLPVLLAPTGLVGLSHWTGELGAALAAEAAGTTSIASTSSTYSIEEIGRGTATDHFFQLYPCSDGSGLENLTGHLMQRAADSGFAAMFVTVDVPAVGNRESERKRGMGAPPLLTPGRVLNAARKPRWTYNFFRHRRVSARNIVAAGGAKAAVRSANLHALMINPELNWDHLSWMRNQWPGPLFVKGILHPDDAAKAVDLGADGIVVSNHGGRQLEGALAALDALPAVVDRVGDRVEVLVDGGVRRGSDVVKALALGARAVCIGRPYLYGLAVGGPDGARRVIEILREEIIRTLILMGVADVNLLDRSWLHPADQPMLGIVPTPV